MAVALAILGVVGGFAGPAIKVAKSIAAPVGRQFSYLCCFRSNIKTLKDEAKTLEDKTRGLQAKVGAARNNVRLIVPEVETWLSDSVKMQNGINGILHEAPDMESGCLKLRERYSLSRKAKKTANAIKELVEKCKFNDDTISYPPAPNEFESRREVEDEIMKCLEDKKVYKIGIVGMGGLGKTTMARKIMGRARGEGMFEEAVMAVVSLPVDKLNIQLQIGEQLGVKFEDNTLIPRAHILRSRLKGKKKSLLVLDDVWESLDLEELGIPCEDGCKVLLTSRDKGVFKAMDVKEVRELKILDEEEAWILFSYKAGIYVDDDALLNTIARDVMRECKGLPLALATVGKALKGVNNIAIWRDALKQLRKHKPDIIKEVYRPLLMNDKVEDEMGNLIRGSTELNVLLIMKYNLMTSLPALKMSLTTLVLLSCDSLESIAVVGQLESLEILICHSCCSIKELPEQVRGLRCLKLLEISECEKLKRIAAGVISSLVALEELKIVDTSMTGKEGRLTRSEMMLRV